MLLPALSRSVPLNGLRVFEAAARHQSFVKAAEELGVTPAAVSQQVKGLEEHLRVPLFRRVKNQSLLLTGAGQTLAPGVRDGLEKIELALHRLRAGLDPQVLTVTAVPSLAAKWLVPRLDRFRAARPDVAVHIEATSEVVDLARRPVDVALRYGAGIYPGLHAEKLMNLRVFPVCSPSLLAGSPPVTGPADLCRFVLLHDLNSESNGSLPGWDAWMAAAGVPGAAVGPELRFSNTYLAIEGALSGRGVALGIDVLVEADIKSGRLVKLMDVQLSVDFAYYFVSHPRSLELPKVRAFRDWLSAEAALYDQGWPETA